ncbi:polysaccharide biosynthesis/export family protein [Donghicola sp. XS_ASV15]|uniref:polysaccharide biosynthesis/export family protein n=1 Tax=Donghicola sp. XS_ASV15 TaxID=3241295 RepID=UPI0035194D28
MSFAQSARTSFLFALLTFVLSIFVAWNPAQADNYKIKVGDTLQIEVLEDTNLSRPVLVLPDGNINFPFAGTIRAAGQSVGAVQSSIVSKLSPNFNVVPNVFVSVASLAPPRPVSAPIVRTYGVYAMGEINTPGRLDIDTKENVTILQAIATAGGFTRFAATRRIELRRVDPKTGQESRYIFDYKGGRGISGATPLREGDVIVVPERRLFE